MLINITNIDLINIYLMESENILNITLFIYYIIVIEYKFMKITVPSRRRFLNEELPNDQNKRVNQFNSRISYLMK